MPGDLLDAELDDARIRGGVTDFRRFSLGQLWGHSANLCF
jgi:hypothetical protein